MGKLQYKAIYQYKKKIFRCKMHDMIIINNNRLFLFDAFSWGLYYQRLFIGYLLQETYKIPDVESEPAA